MQHCMCISAAEYSCETNDYGMENGAAKKAYHPRNVAGAEEQLCLGVGGWLHERL
jgi:hypothetical protein